MPPSSFPVVEVFGPTVQGEGPLAGVPTSFVRFGGCDYRCSWCDSMYAVDPAEWRDAPRLTADEIIERIPDCRWVTLSGGNPALYDLLDLVTLLHMQKRYVAVETQGSIWRPWLARVRQLVLSPKPPSSGMATERHTERWKRFIEQARPACSEWETDVAVKIVVFDEDDLDWAERVLTKAPWEWEPCLSVGTDPGASRDLILDRYEWLCGAVLARGIDARVLPQLHVLAWGHARAV